MSMSLPLFRRLIDELPVGIVLLDQTGRVVHYNQAEERLAGRSREQTLGREFFIEVAPCMNVRELAGQFYDGIGRTELNAKVEFSFPFVGIDRPRDVVAELRSFSFADQSYGCLFVEDVSAQRAMARLRENLSQMLIHDLKNPLASILMNLQFASEELAPGTNPTVDEALADSVVAGRRLQTMLLTLLDVARLETHTMPVVRQPVDLRALAGQAVGDAAGLARSRGIVLTAALPSTPVNTTLDVHLVRRSLDNLIENALRYARHSVRVTVESGAQGARLLVSDDGPGVPAELREAVFEKHVQVSDAGRQHDNRGLGLTFVRMVARAHGGEATLICAPGAGSVFTITLPA